MSIQLGSRPLGVLLVFLGCLGAGATRGADTRAAEPAPADKAAVLAIVKGFEDAWNRHDTDAFAALFHEDAAWAHWRGGYFRGRDEIKQGHLAIHQTFYKNTHMQTIAVEDVTFLTDIVAVTHDRADMTGDERSPVDFLETLAPEYAQYTMRKHIDPKDFSPAPIPVKSAWSSFPAPARCEQ